MFKYLAVIEGYIKLYNIDKLKRSPGSRQLSLNKVFAFTLAVEELKN